mgnify:CR=1 FL=1
MGTLKTTNIQSISGSGTVTLGVSGETFDIPSGVTLDSTGATITGALTMTPAFEAQRPQSVQVVTDNTNTKVQFSTENFDSDSCYDNSSNYRFTPNVAGKYFVYARIMCRAESNGELIVAVVSLQKNGTTIGSSRFDNNSEKVNNKTPVISQIVDMNGSSDYVECFGQVDVGSGAAQFYNDSDERTIFGAYKLIGV